MMTEYHVEIWEQETPNADGEPRATWRSTDYSRQLECSVSRHYG